MTSLACFEPVMKRVLSGMTFVSLLIYLDDIVFGQTFNIHLRNLEEDLKRLAEASLKLNPKTFLPITSFLPGPFGFGSWHSRRQEKTKVVQNWPIPRNVLELRSFIGL